MPLSGTSAAGNARKSHSFTAYTIHEMALLFNVRDVKLCIKTDHDSRLDEARPVI
jgi:hypothetical protein